jgi:hypothetical protein
MLAKVNQDLKDFLMNRNSRLSLRPIPVKVNQDLKDVLMNRIDLIIEV